MADRDNGPTRTEGCDVCHSIVPEKDITVVRNMPTRHLPGEELAVCSDCME